MEYLIISVFSNLPLRGIGYLQPVVRFLNNMNALKGGTIVSGGRFVPQNGRFKNGSAISWLMAA
jgi:hypothetical protein